MNQTVLTENLKKKGFLVSQFDNAADATAYLADALKGKTVGIGGSLTVKEMGLEDLLRKNATVYWHWNAKQVEEFGGAKKVRDLAATTQIYIASANAISQTGEIVNIDGSGNRIASTAYGHEKVYFVVGENKITDTLENAIWRARNVASPLNAKRLGKKTPCAVKGDKCYDCNSPERICNGFLILDRPMTGMEMEVVLVGENLGA